MAPQLKRAWASLIIGLLFFTIIISIIITNEPLTFIENQSIKELAYGMMILGIALYGVVVLFFRSREQKNSVLKDERDHIIGMKAMKYQLWIRSLVLLIWMIALIETYDHQQSIPLVYPYFMFFTTIISGALAQSLGIIMGYARGEVNA
jgi:amino acid transporter